MLRRLDVEFNNHAKPLHNVPVCFWRKEVTEGVAKRRQDGDKPGKEKTSVFMPPELICYNENDNLVVGLLSV